VQQPSFPEKGREGRMGWVPLHPLRKQNGIRGRKIYNGRGKYQGNSMNGPGDEQKGKSHGAGKKRPFYGNWR